MAAEALRLREEIRATVCRGSCWAVVAMGLLLGALVFAHIAAWVLAARNICRGHRMSR